MERRKSVRHTLAGRVTALTCTSQGHNPSRRICALHLTNMSQTGLGATVQDEIEVGARVTVFFPPHGAEHGFDFFGIVVRCQRHESGQEIGIEFQSRMAA